MPETTRPTDEWDNYLTAKGLLQALRDEKDNSGLAKTTMQRVISIYHPAISTACWMVYARLSRELQELKHGLYSATTADQQQDANLINQIDTMSEQVRKLGKLHKANTTKLSNYSQEENRLEALKRKAEFYREAANISYQSLIPLKAEWDETMLQYGIAAFQIDPIYFIDNALTHLDDIGFEYD